LINVLSEITGQKADVKFDSPREGDIQHSLAVTEKMNSKLGITVKVSLKQGLEKFHSSRQG